MLPTPIRPATNSRSTASPARPATPYRPPTADGTKGEHHALPVLSSNLPFTGLSLWIALVIAAGLSGAGMGFRKLAPRTR